MNNTIKSLLADLERIDNTISAERQKVCLKLAKAANELFSNDKALTKAIENLESASMYGSDQGGIYRWYRYSGLEEVPNELRDCLENYVHEHGASVDWENSCLMIHEGGCIVINDDGDVLDTDSGKWIVSKKDYETESERNALIEAHMQRTGYFPGVFSEDRHGNVFAVKTN